MNKEFLDIQYMQFELKLRAKTDNDVRIIPQAPYHGFLAHNNKQTTE